ncbi:RBR-type E3 ubiquitin transferase [Caenorhabditis elegans]|nr:RBR-type E3 ubiquitin transferase [Caenorhabditis elegans]CAB60562.1 RBR-type E3 ubiquitin transferase [Caenorhabditis elegans]|eukprot:NP_001255869.1 RBR-type E3 ubiquitin transferase [Caenorhabditis elegans]
MSYITDPFVIAAYRKLIISSYVETNSQLKWCPGAGCGKAVKGEPSDREPAVCTCGERFCFACAQDWHDPLSCRHMKMWRKKCSDDSETLNWINANTKPCPKCSVTIEKNGGCNHMSCKSSSCRYEFCWLCLGDWKNHAQCNRYVEDDNKTDSRSLSRKNLQRYLFYYNRFMAHQNSMKLEGKLYAKVEVKMDLMQALSMSWIEVQFLRRAVDALCECRRTLKYAYAFAYYLEANNMTTLFETNQSDLELATEQLSGMLEGDLEDNDLAELKRKVQDKYRYVELRRKKMLDHCAEGVELDSWVFCE